MKMYDTVTEAISDLKSRGYINDFNLGFNGIPSHKLFFSLAPDKFEITEVYRFEGDTDPDDETVVYAIESKEGIKGTIVNGYGPSADPYIDEMIKDLPFRH
jgi:hypothetical protein